MSHLAQIEDVKKLPMAERGDAMGAIADAAEEQTFQRRFSFEDRAAVNEDIASTASKYRAIEKEFKAIKADYDAKLKALKNESGALLDQHDAGSATVTEVVYLMHDHAHARVYTYDQFGELVGERLMKSDERNLDLAMEARRMEREAKVEAQQIATETNTTVLSTHGQLVQPKDTGAKILNQTGSPW